MSSETLSNIGTIVSVRGSVVDVRFEVYLPPINSLLHAGREEQIVIEVWAQLSAHTVRGIALTPTQGLARGMAVTDTGGPLQAYLLPARLPQFAPVSSKRNLRQPLWLNKSVCCWR
jgi:F0F1-type ATP synthase beta subunit